jgi:hypothetical protein
MGVEGREVGFHDVMQGSSGLPITPRCIALCAMQALGQAKGLPH